MTTEKENRKNTAAYFGMAAAFAAPFFLFNPDYTLLDLLPDCIGYLLLWVSLRRLRDLNSYFDTAASGFSKLALVSFLKFLSFFICLVLFDSRERPTMILLLLFGFGIGELLLAFPAFRAYFMGFDFSGFVYPEKKKHPEKSYSASFKKATLFFLVFKELITILPEFSVLSEHKYIDSGVQWYEFTGMFRTLAIMVLTVAGIIWLVRAERFMFFTSKNGEAFEKAGTVYAEKILAKPGIISRRRVGLLAVLATVAVLLSCDMNVDGVNIIPDFASGVLLVLFFVLAKDYIPHRRAGIILSSLYSALSVATWFMSVNFRDSYGFSRIRKDPEIYSAFWKFYPFEIVQALLLAAVIVLLTVSLKQLISDHCGYIPESMDAAFRERKLREIRRGLNLKLGFSTAVFLISALASGAADYVSSFPGYVWTDGWWIICAALSLLSAALYAGLSSAIRTEVDSRYMFL